MADADAPRANWGRVVVAVVGLVLGLLLLNAGFNLIGDEYTPPPPSGSTRGTRGSSSSGSLPPAATTPGTTAPGTTAAGTPR